MLLLLLAPVVAFQIQYVDSKIISALSDGEFPGGVYYISLNS